MTQVLIGVGGSGQHIVLAYLRVLALGNATSAQVPHVFLIDADAQLEQNQGRKSQLVSDIKQLHDQLKQVDQNADQKPAEFEIIRPYNTTLASSSEVKVKDIVLGKSQYAPIEVQAFFNQDDLDVKLSEGMHANPKVGSTVFGEKLANCMKSGVISVEELPTQISQQFGRLFAPHVTGSQAKPLKVVVVGSVFGGTGSGIIPTLARNLSQVLGAGSVAITTVTTLPWFSLKAGSNGQQGSALNEGRLQRNTSFALRNFQKQLNTQDNSAVVSSVFIQSAPQWPIIERPSAGDFDQPEHPHVINLIAAHAVQQAFIGGSTFASGQMYVPVVHTEIEANQGQFSPLYSDHLKFSHSNGQHNEHLWNLLVCSDMTAYILKVAADVLDQYDQGSFEKYSKVDGLSAKSAQYVAILKLLDKIREAQGIEFESTKGTFLGIGKKQYTPNKVAQSLAKALRQVSVQLSDSLTWINKLSVQEGSTGIQPVFNDYLFANVKGTEAANAEKYKQIWDRVVNSSDQTNVVQGEIAESRALKALQAMLEHSENDQKNLIQTHKAAGRVDQLDQKIADLLARQLYSVLHSKYLKPISTIQQQLPAPAFQQKTQTTGLSKTNLPVTPVENSTYGSFKWDATLTGEGSTWDEVDARHPRTLHWLEAYRSSQIYGNNSVHDIQVREEGVQGVPNILSSFLIQEWRFEGYAASSIDSLLHPAKLPLTGNIFFSKNNQFQSSKLGLYLHAQRVVEAAFWLLLSGSSEVQFKEFDLSTPEGAYQTWLELELKSKGWGSKIGMICTNDDKATPLFLWNGLLWCLAANRAAEEFFAKLLNTRDLPSLRCRYTDLFSRDSTPNADRQKSIDVFFASQLKVLKKQVEEAIQSRPELALSPLNTALAGILSDLPDVNVGVERLELTELSPALWLGRNLPIKGLGAVKQLKALQSMLLSKLPFVLLDEAYDDDAKPDAANISRFLPVKKEYWASLSNDSSNATSSMYVKLLGTELCEVKHLDLCVPELGLHRLEKPFGEQKPLFVSNYQFTFAVSVWPDFKTDGWQLYYLSCEFQSGLEFDKLKQYLKSNGYSDQLRLNVYDEASCRAGQGGQKASFELTSIPVRVEFVPAVLELCCGDTVIATSPVQLKAVHASAKLEAIGLDFGTSNTCMAMKPQGAKQGQNISLANTIDDSSAVEELLIYSSTFADETERKRLKGAKASFYLTRHDLVDEEQSYTLPSELLLNVSNHQASQSLASQIQYLQTVVGKDQSKDTVQTITPPRLSDIRVQAPVFTPLCQEFYGYNDPKSLEVSTQYIAQLIRSSVGQVKLIHGDIKWPQAGDGEYNLSQSLRQVYLEQVLVSALARLKRQGYGSTDYLFITQPDAFALDNNNFANSYPQKIADLIGQLTQYTGFKFTKSQPIVVSETDAARQTVRLSESQSFVVIDMGGGTTDIAIQLNCHEGKQKLQFTSSIKWAGNALLSAVLGGSEGSEIRKHLEKNHLPAGQKDEDLAIHDQLLLALLKKQIRSNAPMMREMQGNVEKVTQVVRRFFEALYEYVFIKIKLLLQQAGFDLSALGDELNIVLQGNGFRLNDYFYHDTCSLPRLDDNNHLMPEVWQAVFANDDHRNQVQLKLSYQKSSKQDMIARGAMNSAGDLNQEGLYKEPQSATAQVLLPAGILDIAQAADQIVLVPYEQMKAITPKIKLSPEQLIPQLRSLHPYTQRYWPADPKEVAFALVRNKYGSKRLYDLGAVYLLGDGAQDSWSFWHELQQQA
jgi:hypothetical protein